MKIRKEVKLTVPNTVEGSDYANATVFWLNLNGINAIKRRGFNCWYVEYDITMEVKNGEAKEIL